MRSLQAHTLLLLDLVFVTQVPEAGLQATHCFPGRRYEWMYDQPHINWSPTEADDPDSLTFQLDPNNYRVRGAQSASGVQDDELCHTRCKENAETRTGGDPDGLSFQLDPRTFGVRTGHCCALAA